ncbi:lon protease homolog 2, peroxisomal isoform X2 [Takifugu flavidus]|uniref:lon protease homolog 2, peroxisomal isoform X2 n=1 Tax=Takifugu flavidus TaxID=433684 RepID=UPI002543FC06|nr:lon protease homolog 2, peroxisomal isoform X2 [Takifugu flavidus]
MTSDPGIRLPGRLPLLLTHEGVLLPGSTGRFSVDSPRNMNLVRQRLLRGTSLKSTIIGVIPSRDPEQHTDELPALHKTGTAGLAVQVVGSNWPKPHYTLLITGLCRFKVSGLLQERPFVLAEVEQLDKLDQYTAGTAPSGELVDLSDKFYQAAAQLVDMLDMSVPVVSKLKRLLDTLPRETLPDVVASMIRASNKEKLQVLDAVDLEERFRTVLPMLTRQIEALNLLQKSRKLSPASAAKGPGQRFRHDGNDEDEDGDDTAVLERKVHAADMPEAALKVCLKELKRLKKMPPSMPEYALTRNYLDLMVDLPWSRSTKDQLDIGAARRLLDEDHYALDKLKRRVLEYLAVRQLKTSLKGPILCFVGPPGVGKTSVGRSIARTLGREFHRIALGGVCDQSDIRGHRRTYVGSLPGRIINGLKTAGVNNPVFLLDEVDKLGKSLQGDPAAALLEVLDPEQNHSFTDHYLNVAFDLSQVLFIATANTVATIPPALLDRMEVLQVPGYTQEERVQIAHRHLIPNQLQQHGLTPQQLLIPQDSTQQIISRYTREAGVRSLERKIAAICRAVAVKVAEGHGAPKELSSECLEQQGGGASGDAHRGRPHGPERHPGTAHVRHGGVGAAHPARRGGGSGVDPPGWRAHVRGSQSNGGGRSADPDRPAGRRHEGVGSPRHQLAPDQRQALPADQPDGESGSAGRDRHPPPLPCRGGDEGRPVRGRYHSNLPGLAVQRAPGQVGRRHDRRDHAQGAGAAGGRDQRQGAGRSPGGGQVRRPPQAQPEGPGRASG